MLLGSILRRILPELAVVQIDYHLHPELRDPWGGAFNGQCERQQIFMELLANCRFTHIVETGTYRGTTTEFLARESRLPVFTVEADRKAHRFARLRFKRYDSIRLFSGDSRSFLSHTIPELLPRESRPFFYLDAHWQEDLPLQQELEIILKSFSNSVIMIDDFEVPGDPGYTFDNYGDGKILTATYLVPVFRSFSITAAYPSLPSKYESGSKRGCIVLFTRPMEEALSKITALRRDARIQ